MNENSENGAVRKRLLDPEDFPITIEVLRSDNRTIVWAVTVLKPPPGVLVPLHIPPFAKQEGVPMLVRTKLGQGPWTETGPYVE